MRRKGVFLFLFGRRRAGLACPKGGWDATAVLSRKGVGLDLSCSGGEKTPQNIHQSMTKKEK